MLMEGRELLGRSVDQSQGLEAVCLSPQHFECFSEFPMPFFSFLPTVTPCWMAQQEGLGLGPLNLKAHAATA